MKSELDLKSSKVILNCANLEFRVQGLEISRWRSSQVKMIPIPQAFAGVLHRYDMMDV